MYKKYAKLDVVPGGEPQRFHISEHDVRSRHLPFTLFASEGELDLPQGTAANLEGTKPDGTELTVPATINGVGVTVDLPEAAANIKGEIPCKIVLTKGESRLETERFILVVDPDVKED